MKKIQKEKKKKENKRSGARANKQTFLRNASNNGARGTSGFFLFDRHFSFYTERKRSGQTAVEYLLILASAIVFITVAAYYIKNNVLTG